MRIVLDTNVILSALLTRGLSARVLDACLNRHCLFVSDFLLGEVTEKLAAKFKADAAETARVRAFLEANAVIQPVSGPQPDACRDKDDNAVLQLAACAKADLLVTGDRDLLVLEAFAGIPIITPRQFVELHGGT